MISGTSPVADHVPVAARMRYVRVGVHASGIRVPAHAIGCQIGVAHDVLADLVDTMPYVRQSGQRPTCNRWKKLRSLGLTSVNDSFLLMTLLDGIHFGIVESAEVVLHLG